MVWVQRGVGIADVSVNAGIIAMHQVRQLRANPGSFATNGVAFVACHRVPKKDALAPQPVSPSQFRDRFFAGRRRRFRLHLRPGREKAAQGEGTGPWIVSSIPGEGELRRGWARGQRHFQWQPLGLAHVSQDGLLPPLAGWFGSQSQVASTDGEGDAREKSDRHLLEWPFIVEFRPGLDGRLKHLPDVKLAADGQSARSLKAFPE